MSAVNSKQDNTKYRIAVGSGKGGVGKSTTSVNLAIYYAKKGKKTLIADLDPLSDIKTIIDREDLKEGGKEPVGIFENLYLLTPFQDTGKTAPDEVYENLESDSYKIMENRFDIIIFDLPAGSDERENLAFLDFADILLVVTNPDPASHVASGGYIKKAAEKKPDLPVFIWHNRYEKSLDSDFNPDDVAGNFNKNVADDEKLKPFMAGKFLNVAKIPRDSSLDLLGTDTTFGAVALRNIVILLELLYSEITMPIVSKAAPGKRIGGLINSYVSTNKKIDDPDEFIDDLFRYIGVFLSRLGRDPDAKINLSMLLSDDEREGITVCLESIKNDKKLIDLRKAITVTKEALLSLENSSRQFYAELVPDKYNTVVREVSAVIKDIETATRGKTEKNIAGVILFYLAVFNLIKQDKYHNAMIEFLPMKKDKNGNPKRDRNTQIKMLVEKNLEYQKKFISLVKKLQLPLMEEIERLTADLSILEILFTSDKNGKTRIESSVYAKLLGNYLHDSLNSGLSIIIGFPYRTASMSFQKSAILVLGLLND
ncbi:MAG: AAA family ATPase [Spirochaetia bacterium]|jgi:flagellar biosynthesis protein FlhG|nr:AAA family ATPase [Spirochaetia bacterium]